MSAFTAGILWGAASSAVIVPPRAPLPRRRLQRQARGDGPRHPGDGALVSTNKYPGADPRHRGPGLGQVAAVVLLVVVEAELEAVVAAAHQTWAE